MHTTLARLRGVLLMPLIACAVVLPALPAAAAVSPTIEATPAACNLLGATDVLVRASGLAPGQTYTVRIEGVVSHHVLNAQQVTGDTPTSTFLFADVPNGNSYLIWIANEANTLSASTTVSISVCDLPTLPDDSGGAGTAPDAGAGVGRAPDPPLAVTGSTPVLAAIGAVGLIQLGIVLIGVAAMSARTRPRGA